MPEITVKEPVKEMGVVKQIVENKYGFIATIDDGDDRFFHWSAVSPNSPKPFHFFNIGDKVKFIPAEKDGKRIATSVEAIFSKSYLDKKNRSEKKSVANERKS